MHRKYLSSKRGFTLLETMLSIAVLLIVTLIVYEGFMTTLNYSGDTALADRVGNDNAGEMYLWMGSNNGSYSANSNAPCALLIRGNLTGANADGSQPKITLVIGASSNSAAGGNSAFASSSINSAYGSGTVFSNTTNRHAFTYSVRTCPECGKALDYYYVTESGATKMYAKCKDTDCPYSNIDDDHALLVDWN